MDAQNYCFFDKLKDGTPIAIRAVRPDDKTRFVHAFKNLDAESIYTRFFRFKSELTEQELKAATEVDFEKAVALVVTIHGCGQDEIIIGGGRYLICDSSEDSKSAEIAFTVEEDYQRQGIASRILQHLIKIAKEKGVSKFEADVLAENKAMLTVFTGSGLPMKQLLEQGTVHVTLFLTAPPA